ncbi:ferritin-like domain-containing protein [Herbaspirillum sp. CF444]|uniref:ferritin-like domain-containing protein n=1 Tax=Herbaspirillum sp. CF444 TaxID=1144319 RepID=UPI003FCD9090
MVASQEQHHQPRWSIADLDFSRIDLRRVRNDENTFYLVACASFVESGSDLYTHNLLDFFSDNAEVAAWLRGQWEAEELQHGRALRAYVEHVWPEFDWQSAYDSFLAEYATYCKVELLEPTKALEMAARCVVETGTATYYRALSRSVKEPVLRDLAARISNDEVNHYKHFYRYFRQYREREGIGRSRVLGTLSRRTLEMRNEDADCAIRHVLKFRDPARANDTAYLRELSARMSTTVRTNLTPEMTLKMIMRPLELSPRVQAWVQYPIQQLMQHVFLR